MNRQDLMQQIQDNMQALEDTLGGYPNTPDRADYESICNCEGIEVFTDDEILALPSAIPLGDLDLMLSRIMAMRRKRAVVADATR